MQIFYQIASVKKNECLLSKIQVNTCAQVSSIKNEVFCKFCVCISISTVPTAHTSQVL